jgi:hypothetical protein
MIKKECEILSDGSHVFNIMLFEDGLEIGTFHATNEKSCDKLIIAIEENTVDVENDNIFDVLKEA